MKSTFRILFYAKWEASDEAKMLPIYVRITINGTKVRFSLKIRVSEKIWDARVVVPSGIATRPCKYNIYLKEIASTLGIQKRVTSHCLRHNNLYFSLKTNELQNLYLRQVAIQKRAKFPYLFYSALLKRTLFLNAKVIILSNIK